MADFAVWAPQRNRVRVQVDGVTHPMTPRRGGLVAGRAGARPRAPATPTCSTTTPPRCPTRAPAASPTACTARRSSTTTSAFFWTDRSWTGRQLPGSVLYELHIGTFTEAGTFDTAIGRLDHLAELGVDLVEVLPVNAVDGARNWGYDGVGWYAVTENYGGPDAFKRFVDACHLRGMGVVLDVVYNHLGPSGAYLDRFGPYFAGSNIWGPTVNLDGSLLRAGAPLRDRQRADVAARLPRRRPAPRRRARPARHAGHPPAGAAGRRGGGALRARRAAALADRRVRPQRRPAGHRARGRRLRPHRASGATTSTTACTPRSPARRRATTPTSPPRASPASRTC